MRYAAETLNSMNVCVNIARHYMLVKSSTRNSVYYMEKAAILGIVEARRFLGNACYNSGDVAEGVKHFIIGAKQGDKQ